jgi:hypothetical protein
MRNTMKWTPVWLAAVAAVAVAWYVQSRPSDVPTDVTQAEQTAVPPPATEPAPLVERNAPPDAIQAATVTAAVRAPSAPLDEAAIMSTLRELGDSVPDRSLKLAREGNERFPNSPDAAERGWYICKSLVNLEDFYDAREEARALVAKYPGTEWATDVQRHLLVNPLDLPGDPPPSAPAPEDSAP